MYIVQTKPFAKVSLTGTTFIHGVRGRVGDIEISLQPFGLNGTFYFEILDQNGGVVETINARRPAIFDKIKAKAMLAGLSEEAATSTANSQTDSIYKSILSGTNIQRYDAMKKFAASYGLELLPLAEQTGNIVINN